MTARARGRPIAVALEVLLREAGFPLEWERSSSDSTIESVPEPRLSFGAGTPPAGPFFFTIYDAHLSREGRAIVFIGYDEHYASARTGGKNAPA